MNSKIDLKSALCGLCLGVLAMLALGATNFTTNPVGRYQMTGHMNYWFVIHTCTGRVSKAAFVNERWADRDFFEPKEDQ